MASDGNSPGLSPTEGFPGTFPASSSVLSGEGRTWRNVGATRLTRAVEEVAVPAQQERVILVNVGRPYELEERLDGRIHRTSGGKGDVAVIPAGTATEFRSRKNGG